MENQKIISLPTNDKKIYRQILVFMNFALNLTNQELEVLSELIKLNNEYDLLPLEKRIKFIHSTEMRKEIREKLNIGNNQYNGLLLRLKAKNYLINKLPILNEDGSINKDLIFKPSDSGFKIEINLINSPTIFSEPEPPQTIENNNTEIKEIIEEKKEKEKDPYYNGDLVDPEYNVNDFTIL